MHLRLISKISVSKILTPVIRALSLGFFIFMPMMVSLPVYAVRCDKVYSSNQPRFVSKIKALAVQTAKLNKPMKVSAAKQTELQVNPGQSKLGISELAQTLIEKIENAPVQKLGPDSERYISEIIYAEFQNIRSDLANATNGENRLISDILNSKSAVLHSDRIKKLNDQLNLFEQLEGLQKPSAMLQAQMLIPGYRSKKRQQLEIEIHDSINQLVKSQQQLTKNLNTLKIHRASLLENSTKAQAKIQVFEEVLKYFKQKSQRHLISREKFVENELTELIPNLQNLIEVAKQSLISIDQVIETNRLIGQTYQNQVVDRIESVSLKTGKMSFQNLITQSQKENSPISHLELQVALDLKNQIEIQNNNQQKQEIFRKILDLKTIESLEVIKDLLISPDSSLFIPDLFRLFRPHSLSNNINVVAIHDLLIEKYLMNKEVPQTFLTGTQEYFKHVKITGNQKARLLSLFSDSTIPVEIQVRLLRVLVHQADNQVLGSMTQHILSSTKNYDHFQLDYIHELELLIQNIGSRPHFGKESSNELKLKMIKQLDYFKKALRPNGNKLDPKQVLNEMKLAIKNESDRGFQSDLLEKLRSLQEPTKSQIIYEILLFKIGFNANGSTKLNDSLKWERTIREMMTEMSVSAVPLETKKLSKALDKIKGMDHNKRYLTQWTLLYFMAHQNPPGFKKFLEERINAEKYKPMLIQLLVARVLVDRNFGRDQLTDVYEKSLADLVNETQLIEFNTTQRKGYKDDASNYLEWQRNNHLFYVIHKYLYDNKFIPEKYEIGAVRNWYPDADERLVSLRAYMIGRHVGNIPNKVNIDDSRQLVKQTPQKIQDLTEQNPTQQNKSVKEVESSSDISVGELKGQLFSLMKYRLDQNIESKIRSLLDGSTAVVRKQISEFLMATNKRWNVLPKNFETKSLSKAMESVEKTLRQINPDQEKDQGIWKSMIKTIKGKKVNLDPKLLAQLSIDVESLRSILPIYARDKRELLTYLKLTESYSDSLAEQTLRLRELKETFEATTRNVEKNDTYFFIQKLLPVTESQMRAKENEVEIFKNHLLTLIKQITQAEIELAQLANSAKNYVKGFDLQWFSLDQVGVGAKVVRQDKLMEKGMLSSSDLNGIKKIIKNESNKSLAETTFENLIRIQDEKINEIILLAFNRKDGLAFARSFLNEIRNIDNPFLQHNKISESLLKFLLKKEVHFTELDLSDMVFYFYKNRHQPKIQEGLFTFFNTNKLSPQGQKLLGQLIVSQKSLLLIEKILHELDYNSKKHSQMSKEFYVELKNGVKNWLENSDSVSHQQVEKMKGFLVRIEQIYRHGPFQVRDEKMKEFYSISQRLDKKEKYLWTDNDNFWIEDFLKSEILINNPHPLRYEILRFVLIKVDSLSAFKYHRIFFNENIEFMPKNKDVLAKLEPFGKSQHHWYRNMAGDFAFLDHYSRHYPRETRDYIDKFIFKENIERPFQHIEMWWPRDDNKYNSLFIWKTIFASALREKIDREIGPDHGSRINSQWLKETLADKMLLNTDPDMDIFVIDYLIKHKISSWADFVEQATELHKEHSHSFLRSEFL